MKATHSFETSVITEQRSVTAQTTEIVKESLLIPLFVAPVHYRRRHFFPQSFYLDDNK
jgi:hypothetical protein